MNSEEYVAMLASKTEQDKLPWLNKELANGQVVDLFSQKTKRTEPTIVYSWEEYGRPKCSVVRGKKVVDIIPVLAKRLRVAIRDSRMREDLRNGVISKEEWDKYVEQYQ